MQSYRRFWALAYALMLTLAACAGSSAMKSTGELIDDRMLTTRVKTALTKEPELKSKEISVETFNGDMQLSGFVSNQHDIDRAMQIAQNTPGVKTVRNDMHLRR